MVGKLVSRGAAARVGVTEPARGARELRAPGHGGGAEVLPQEEGGRGIRDTNGLRVQGAVPEGTGDPERMAGTGMRHTGCWGNRGAGFHGNERANEGAVWVW